MQGLQLLQEATIEVVGVSPTCFSAVVQYQNAIFENYCLLDFSGRYFVSSLSDAVYRILPVGAYALCFTGFDSLHPYDSYCRC